MPTTTELTGAEEVAWDLSDLYEGSDDSRLEAHIQEAEQAAAAFRDRYYGKVAELSAAELAEAIAERERIEEVLTRVGYYAHLHFATDMADPPRGALVARVTEKGAALDTQLLFFGLEIAALEDAAADALLESRELDHWRHWVRSLRKFRPHLLSEPEEKIVTEKTVSGVSAWGRLYEELLGALRVELDGAEVSFEDALSKLYSGDRDLRRSVADAVTEGLGPGLRTRTFIFNTVLVDKSIDDRLRGYATWISSRNLRNDTTDEAVQALVDAAVYRYDVVQRYYTLKAKLIGLDRLAHYDRFAPIGEDPSKVPWSEARDIVVGAYADFTQEAGDIAERFFSESWIDAPVRENKRTGAFCATTVPGVHPYVLMNFTGDRRSILTLAHELGHGLHGALSQPLGLFNADTPLTTAETASVFGEALTFKRLLALEEDPARRLSLLAGRIEDSIATVFRQIAMNRFEDAVHTERRGQGELASERLEELWLESQHKLFADSVDIDGYGRWWSYIPHFLSTPGYVYAYAYGFLFALAIFRRYELEGEAMVEPYLEVLRAGGSKPPEELARMVGLDLTDAGIWASGIDALADELDEAEALATEIGLGA
jgi:oligoendopeptidase F